MKKLLTLLFLFPSIIYAQFLTVYDIDASEYPLMKAKFIVVDAKGNQITDLKLSDVEVFENNKSAKAISITNSKISNPMPISAVLAIDVSGSMSGRNIRIAKVAATAFVDMLPLQYSECAVTSFDNNCYLNCDFTKNPVKLRTKIAALKPIGGTDFDEGFMNASSGALEIAKSGKHKKIVIFLTDGQGMGDEIKIVNQAQNDSITVYCITVGLQIPNVLRNISQKTSGLYYENILTTEQAKNHYLEILQIVQSKSYGTFTWMSEYNCRSEIDLSLNFRNIHTNLNYLIPDKWSSKVFFDPSFLLFGEVNPGTKKSLKFSVINQGMELIIDSITNNCGTVFNVVADKSFPHILQMGETKEYTLNYTPQDSGRILNRLSLRSNSCSPKYLYADGGFAGKVTKTKQQQSFFLLNPNGSETFSVGSYANIRWEGINIDDTVQLSISNDNGITWTKINDVDGLKYRWKIPNTPGELNLIKASQMQKGQNVSVLDVVQLNTVNGKVERAQYSPDGKLILSLYGELWNAETGKLLKTMWGKRSSFNMDGSRVIGCNTDGVEIIETSTFKRELIVRLGAGINMVTFSPDDSKFAVAAKNNTAKICSAASGNVFHVLGGHKSEVKYVVFSPDSKKIITQSIVAKLWDVTTGKKIKSFKYDAIHAAFSPDSKKVITSGDDNSAKIWDIASGKLLHDFGIYKVIISELGFSPDEQLVYVTTNNTEIRDANTGKPKFIVSGNNVSFNANSRLILTKSNNIPKIFDANSGKLLVAVDGQIGKPDGEWQQYNGDRVYNAQTGENLSEADWRSRRKINSLQFSPDGSRILVASKDIAKIWAIISDKSMQSDISNDVFTIVAPKPMAKDVEFDDQLIGTSTDKVIQNFIINKNQFDVVIDTIVIAGTDAKDFQMVSGLPPYVVAADSSYNVEFRFIPSKNGNSEAELLIITPNDTLIKIIKGKGIKQEFEITDKIIDFGKVRLMQKKDTLITLIRNIGTAALTIVDIENVGPDTEQFKIINPKKNITIAPQKTETLKISFASKQRGRANGQISFKINGIAQTQNIILLGEGIAPEKVLLSGKVLNSKTNKPFQALVKCYDLLSNSKMQTINTNTEGNYSFTLQVDRSYSIVAEKDSFMTASENIDLSEAILTDKLTRDIYLSKIEKGSKVLLNNIFFETDKTALLDVSLPEIDRLYQLLKTHPILNIELSGHTDNIGTLEYNKDLSQRRANEIKNKLIQLGTNSNRIETIGYGETKAIATNNTIEGRQKNRRVEFLIK